MLHDSKDLLDYLVSMSESRNPHPVLAIIQARMSSSRLPGKVLLDIAGQPMLVWVCERARQAKLINQVMVATTTDPADDAVEELCHTRGYHYYRGSHSDVLDRYYHAACSSEAEVIVRITADCPLIDPGVIDDTIQAFSGQPVQPDEYITLAKKATLLGEIQISFSILQPTACRRRGAARSPSVWMWKCVPSRRWKKPGGRQTSPTKGST